MKRRSEIGRRCESHPAYPVHPCLFLFPLTIRSLNKERYQERNAETHHRNHGRDHAPWTECLSLRHPEVAGNHPKARIVHVWKPCRSSCDTDGDQGLGHHLYRSWSDRVFTRERFWLLDDFPLLPDDGGSDTPFMERDLDHDFCGGFQHCALDIALCLDCGLLGEIGINMDAQDRQDGIHISFRSPIVVSFCANHLIEERSLTRTNSFLSCASMFVFLTPQH